MRWMSYPVFQTCRKGLYGGSSMVSRGCGVSKWSEKLTCWRTVSLVLRNRGMTAGDFTRAVNVRVG